MNYGEVWKDRRDKEVVMIVTSRIVLILEAPFDPERPGQYRDLDPIPENDVNPQSGSDEWERVE